MSRFYHEPTIDFDYAVLDQMPTDIDSEFWTVQGELLGDILRWLVTPRSLAGMGARCCVLALYLHPEMIHQSTLREIAAMKGAPTVAALSKSMLEFQQRYDLKPARYQKLAWMRDRYRQAQLVRSTNL